MEKEEIKVEDTKKRLPGFKELRAVDLSKYLKKRDGADYVNWATIKQILHDNGAEKVYFEVVQQSNGSSLIMSDKEFIDIKGGTNKVYETRIKVVIDDLVFEIQGPVMNGANPVKDNSMTQQRLWNSQTRLFVKGVAIHTGLGFDMWSRIEEQEEKEIEEELQFHSILKIKERIEQTITNKMKLDISKKEIAATLKLSEKQLDSYFGMYDTLYKLEKAIEKIDKIQE